jgi:hypothetical protein
MAKKRKAKRAKSRGRKAKRIASARKRRTAKTTRRGAARKSARKSRTTKSTAKSRGKRTAKSKLPPRVPAPDAPRPMSPQGPAVTPLAPRQSPFPSSLPADGGPYGGREKAND